MAIREDLDSVREVEAHNESDALNLVRVAQLTDADPQDTTQSDVPAEDGDLDVEGTLPLQDAGTSENVVELEDGAIARLPENASLEQPRVNGANLEFVQPDGSVIVIPNGAVQGLTIFVGNIEIPPQAVAAIFEANDIQVAAGPEEGGPGSSGGNFAIAPGGIGAAIPFGDLLPPTALSFGTFEDRPLYESLIDDDPEIVSISPLPVLDEDGFHNANLDAARLGEVTGSGLTEKLADVVVKFGNDTPDNLLGAFAFLSPDALSGQLQALSGNPIVFALEGGALVGRDGNSAGQELIRIELDSVSVDSGTGHVTYTLKLSLLGAIKHPGSGEDIVTLNGISFQITDGSGDQVGDTISLEILDDIPTIDIDKVAAPAALVVDETDLAVDATGDFAALFAAAISHGADGPGSMSYAFELSAADASSGLFAHGANGAQGAEILLNVNGDSTVITGSAGGVDYFTITINPVTGQVTFDQINAIWHDQTDDHDEPLGLNITGSTLKVVATVTDADGDTASHGVDLGAGNVFTFHDDGPAINTGTVAAPAALVVDESDLNADAFFDVEDVFPAGAFDFGADGPGSVSYALSLVGDGGEPATSGIGSGLYAHGADGAKGGEILLSINAEGTVITGSVGDTAYFTITLDDGKVTLDQLNAIWHDQTDDHDEPLSLNITGGALNLVATVTDADGDTAIHGVDLGAGDVFTFHDDGPSIRGGAKWHIVDEDDIDTQWGPFGSTGTSPNDGALWDGSFTGSPWTNWPGAATIFGSVEHMVDFGADGPGGFAISDAAEGYFAGLGLSSKGHALSYATHDGTLIGYAGYRPVFTFTIDAETGNYTFKLFDQLDHDVPGDDWYSWPTHSDENFDLEDGVANDVFWLNFGKAVTATDGDGDAVSLDGKIKIAIRDDVPELISGRVVIDAVNEDDIKTDWSEGTSPNDGKWDHSYTGSPFNNGSGPATTYGTLAHLVKVGADEVAGGGATFSFIHETFAKLALQSQGLKSNGDALAYDIQGNVLYGYVINYSGGGIGYDEGTDRPVFKLTLNENGTYKFELFDQLDHAHGAGENYLAIDFGKIIKATDADGDSITLGGAFKIAVRDDVPELADGGKVWGVVEEEQLPGGNEDTTAAYPWPIPGWDLDLDWGTTAPWNQFTNDIATSYISGNLASLVAEGADDGGKFVARWGVEGDDVTDTNGDVLTSGGVPVKVGHVSSQHGITAFVGMAGDEPVFKLFLNQNGEWVFVLQGPIDHHDFNSADDVEGMLAIDLSGLIKYIDFDGDSVLLKDGSFIIKVLDDTPEASNPTGNAPGVSNAVLDEDDIEAAGSQPPGTDGTGPVSATGSLKVAFGADGFGSTTFVGFAVPNAGSGDFAAGDATGVDSGLTAGGKPVYFRVVDDGKTVEGYTDPDGELVLRATLDSDDAGYTVTLLGNIDHQAPDGEPGGRDEAQSINFIVAAKDADGDAYAATLSVRIIDDAPEITVSQPQSLVNGLFFDGFTPNNNAWGQGSGVAGTSAGGWTVSASPVGGATDIELQKVGDGWRGADSPTDSVMVDLEATPGNIEISQVISDLTAGESYQLTFEIGKADGLGGADAARLEVVWNGIVVGTFDPQTGVMQTQSIVLEAIDGDNTLVFREIGTSGDNTGTYLANVKINDIIIIDESAGIDVDSDEIGADAVGNLFDGVNAGVDPDMPQPQFARGSETIVDVQTNFGADGPAAGGGLAYAFSLSAHGVSSGLLTTEGEPISLVVDEDGRVLGIYDNGGDEAVAFAFHIDDEGIVTLAQWVSLRHPESDNHDEGLQLASETLSVTVTATDFDGDTASASADISGRFRFEDDGPIANDDTARSVVEGEAPITGNVMDNDDTGADGAQVTHIQLPGGSDFVVLTSGNPEDGYYTFDTILGRFGFKGDGSWTFTPDRNLDNADGIDASFNYRLTDGDGDTSEAKQPITVLDGAGPSGGGSIRLDLDDENLADGTNPSGPDTDSDTISFTQGSDAIQTIAFSDDLSDLHSSLTWERVSDTQIVGKDGGTTIVTLDLVRSGSDATVTATLKDNYDGHSAPLFLSDDNQTSLGSVKIVASDIDGDSAEGTVSVRVSDDVPERSGEAEHVEVDEQNIGTGPATLTGTLADLVTPGADDPLTFSFTAQGWLGTAIAEALGSALGLSSKGENLSYDIQGNALYAFAGTGGYDAAADRLVFKFVLETNGDYTFELHDQLDHDAPNDDNGWWLDPGDNESSAPGSDRNLDLQDSLLLGDVDSLHLGKLIKATDADGDSVILGGKFTVAIRDDVPEAVGDTETQSAENAAVVVDVKANDVSGADGVYWDNDPSVVVTWSNLDGAGILTYNNDGTFTYTPAAGEEGEVTFDYTIEDGDRDTSTATVTITLKADSEPAVSVVRAEDDDGVVWESALPGGSGGGDLTASGSLDITHTGDDTTALIEVQDKDGNWVEIAADGTIVEGKYGQVSVNTDGSWTYTLSGNTTAHDGLNETGAADQVQDSFAVRVTDSDGDATDGSAQIVIDINDDGPTAVDDTDIQSAENDPVEVNVFANDTAGADGVDLATDVALVADSLSGLGTIAYDGNGTFTYTPASGEEGKVTFEYEITDGDGDTSTATVTITLLADSKPTVSVVTDDGEVWESALPGGSGGGDLEANGSLTINTGGDTLDFIEVQDKDDNWIKIENDGTQVTGKYGTLSVNLNGTWSYLLGGNTEDHSEVDLTGADDQVQDSFAVRVTDSDGDATDGSAQIVIDINDDGPTAVDDTELVVAETDGQTSGINLLANDIQGADGVTVTHVSFNGGTSWDEIGDGPFDVSGVGTFSFAANGDWSLDPEVNVSASDISGSFLYRITDGDGDTSEAAQAYTVTNVNTAPTADNITIRVSEEELPGGNPDDIGDEDTTNDATATGDLNVDDAEGDALTITFTSTPAGLTSGGEALTWTGLNTGTLIGSVGTTTIITLTVAADGMVTAALSGPLDHPDGGGQNELAFDVDVDVSDGQYDTATSVTVIVEDDAPVDFSPTAAVLINKSGESYTCKLDTDGNIDDNLGADGGTIRFAPSLSGANSGLTSGGLSITYAIIDDGLTLVGSTVAGEVFRIELNPDGSLAEVNDTYEVTLSRPVDGGAVEVAFTDGSYEFTGGNTHWKGFTQQDTVGSQDLLLTPIGSDGQTINGNANSAGVGGGGSGQSIGSNEGIRLDFVIDLAGTPDSGGSGNGYQTIANRNHTFDGHYNANGAGVTIAGSNSSTKIEFRAFDDFDTNNTVGDGTPDSVIAIAISFDGDTEYVTLADIGTTATNVTVGALDGLADRTFTVQFVLLANGEYAATVVGANASSSLTDVNFAIFTDDGYSSLEVMYVSGGSFTLGGFVTSTIDPGQPVHFNLPVELVDGDGDTSTSSISVGLAPNEAGADIQDFSDSDTGVIEIAGDAQSIIGSDFDDTLNGSDTNNILVGGAGDDILTGGGGDDILIGGLGNDELWGGGGNDVFVFNETGAGNVDTIEDYVVSEDVIDLSGLLAGLGVDDGNKGQFVKATLDGDDVTIQADLDGGADSFNDVAILNNYTGQNVGDDTVNIMIDGEEYDVPVL